jgi:hypothetical protein
MLRGVYVCYTSVTISAIWYVMLPFKDYRSNRMRSVASRFGLCSVWGVAARPQLASGSDTKLLECRTFRPVEVTFAGGCLLKDVLRHFQRRDGLADQEASIRNNLVQRLPHNGDRWCIKFLFQVKITHRSQPKSLGASWGSFVKG